MTVETIPDWIISRLEALKDYFYGSKASNPQGKELDE